MERTHYNLILLWILLESPEKPTTLRLTQTPLQKLNENNGIETDNIYAAWH